MAFENTLRIILEGCSRPFAPPAPTTSAGVGRCRSAAGRGFEKPSFRPSLAEAQAVNVGGSLVVFRFEGHSWAARVFWFQMRRLILCVCAELTALYDCPSYCVKTLFGAHVPCGA